MAATLSEDRVLDVLRTSGRASVAELASTLDVGEATVRRALGRLERDGRIVRTYGGAMLPGTAVASGDPEIAAKRAIGAAAAALVQDGDTVALSSGSTVLELARCLHDRPLTVITNAMDVATTLIDSPGTTLVVLGGVLLPSLRSLLGHLTEQSTHDLRADTVFMGASAVDLGHGFMTDHVPEIQTDRALRRMARDCVLLVDAGKFDRVAPGFMFGFEDVTTVVTDERIRPDTRAALEGRGLRVIVAGERGGAPREP